MTKKQSIIITILSVTAFILTLMVSGRFWFRLDLTKNKSFTISNVSRSLFRELPDNVSITYYLSDKLKSVLPAAGEIEDTLREYAAYSRGKITLTVMDPVKSGYQITADELGLSPKQIQSVDRDQASFITVYSGVVIEFQGSIDVIPWITSTDTLEYDITSRIRAMISGSERQIGIIVADSFRQWNEDFSYLNMTLSEAGYRILRIAPGEEIPDSLPALFVFGGCETLDDWALYRIDRYIQLGGKVLFAVKGVYVDTYYGSIEARPQNDLGLLDMISSYGVTIRRELALDRSALLTRYQSQTFSGGAQYKIASYPLWIAVLGENGNKSHPVSAGFNGLDLYWSSPLELHASDNVEAVSLFTSTDEAWLMRGNFYTNPDIVYLMELDAMETIGPKILGAALSGTFRSFFRDAAKPEREWTEEELPEMPTRPGYARIIVVGDTDFATNIIGATSAAHNLEFLTRAADWLTSDDDVISIRNRQPQAGRLDKIQDTYKRASAMMFSQALNVGLVPVLVIAAGVFLSFRRKKRAKTAPAKESRDDV